jgi:hypothetical protein
MTKLAVREKEGGGHKVEESAAPSMDAAEEAVAAAAAAAAASIDVAVTTATTDQVGVKEGLEAASLSPAKKIEIEEVDSAEDEAPAAEAIPDTDAPEAVQDASAGPSKTVGKKLAIEEIDSDDEKSVLAARTKSAANTERGEATPKATSVETLEPTGAPGAVATGLESENVSAVPSVGTTSAQTNQSHQTNLDEGPKKLRVQERGELAPPLRVDETASPYSKQLHGLQQPVLDEEASAPVGDTADSPHKDGLAAIEATAAGAPRTRHHHVQRSHRGADATGTTAVLDGLESPGSNAVKSDSANAADHKAPKSIPPRPDAESGEPRAALSKHCSSCGNAERTAQGQMELFECSSCGGAYHRKCLGLRAVPAGEWHCPSCRIGTSRSSCCYRLNRFL